MEIKLQCGCGTKYAFEVEPVNGCMPVRVQCPSCGTDGTFDANQIIARKFQYAPPPPSAPMPRPAPSVARAATSVSNYSSPAIAAAEPEAAVAAAGYAGASLLQRTTFFIKERVAGLKLTDTYDILDPATGRPIGIAKEEPPTWAKWLRLATNKNKLPTAIKFYEQEGQPPVLSIHRGFTLIRSKIRVTAGDGRNLGYFLSKVITLGGGFKVFDHADQPVAEVKGDWKGWNFRFVNKHGREIGTVTKKWAGLARELLTSADNYVISLTDLAGAGPDAGALLLAAGLAIDIVYNEGGD
jgi:hypothetical protein